MRTVAFISGAFADHLSSFVLLATSFFDSFVRFSQVVFIPAPRRGSSSDVLMHGADWYAISVKMMELVLKMMNYV